MQIIHLKTCWPTVAERSKASVLRSWKRKVVGSNPGDAKFDRYFSFGDWVDLIGSIAKRIYIELSVHTPCYWVLDLLCVISTSVWSMQHAG